MLAYFFSSCIAAWSKPDPSCLGNPSRRLISSYASPCNNRTTCARNKISHTLNLHSPPISSVLSKQVGSSPSSTQHFREISPLTPAPITATFFAMVSCHRVDQSVAFSGAKDKRALWCGQVLGFKCYSSGNLITSWNGIKCLSSQIPKSHRLYCKACLQSLGSTFKSNLFNKAKWLKDKVLGRWARSAVMFTTVESLRV